MAVQPTFALQVSGTQIDAGTLENNEAARLFDVEAAYDLTASARGAGASHIIEFDDELVQLTTEDGIVWYGYADDIPDIVGEPIPNAKARGASGTATPVFVLPSAIRDKRSTSRGLWSFVKNKFLRKLKRKAVEVPAELTAHAIGKRIDEKQCPTQGLFRVLKDRSLKAATKEDFDTTKPALLFIHGTISSFKGGYSNMDDAGWKALHQQYGANIFAFNHYTLTESPCKNAQHLLPVLPKGLQLDLITHSRGGLIGDILVRCDARRRDERGYAKAEIEKVRNAKPHAAAASNAYEKMAEELVTLNQLATRTDFTIGKIVRVACPAQGTRLLDDRLDHFAQVLFNGIKYLAAPAAGVLELLETFVLAVLAEREDPSTFPGLLAMRPGSPLVALNNTIDVELPGTLVSVAGDSEVGGGIGKSLIVIIGNLYFTSANDLVVHTSSMSRGIVKRLGGNFQLLLQNKHVNHFAYFRLAKHMKVVTKVLATETITVGLELEDGLRLIDNLTPSGGRGVAINKAYQPGELRPERVSGTRPIVVMLPGIMGSNLYFDGELQWVKLTALMNGALADKLKFVKSDGDTHVKADSVIADFYGDLAEHLNAAGFDVSLHPFDWRQSLKDEAKKLRVKLLELQQTQQSIHILAHSMGGLLMRQFMIDNPREWKTLRDYNKTKIIFLGTPWRGSHLITQLLTGHLARIRQLGLLDLKHSREALLNVVHRFPGVTQLLPLDDPRTFDLDEWSQLAKASREGTPVYAQTMQAQLIRFKNDVEKGLKKLTFEDYDRMIYVAGHHESTVDDYRIRYRRFFNRHVVDYLGTTKGDGSVTWARGIPRKLPSSNLYYTRVEHGRLAAEKSLFIGLVDLLKKGSTQHSAFAKTPPVNASARGGSAFAKTTTLRKEPLSGLSPTEVLFGIKTPQVAQTEQVDPVFVRVFNGDLKWARYPLMVGHFEGFSIISAERALDQYLGNVLTERHLMGFYPSAIGEQELIVDTTRRPHGAVIVGLGEKEELTGYLLAKTVEKGLLKYAMFRRDNQLENDNEANGGLGVSMLIIGSNFGQLPMHESLRNLLLGVKQANETIATFNRERSDNVLKKIVEVEIVDYYEDRAYEAYQIIQDISQRGDIAGLQLSAAIEEGFGRKKRFLRENSQSWWQPITAEVATEKIRILSEEPKELSSELDQPQEIDYEYKYLAFDIYNRGSSISTSRAGGNFKLAKSMADQMSHLNADIKRDSKVLFELLIPKRYKDFIRNHRNLLWRVDTESAAFPWELFNDESTGHEPTFVRAGMIRQLKSATSDIRVAPVRQKQALVIADPLLGSAEDEFSQLSGAKTEGLKVSEMLNAAAGYSVHDSIGAGGLDTLRDLVARPYRIIHIAAHGVFSKLPGKTGVVIEDGELLTPETLGHLSHTPELVFVNCCHLGDVEATIEAASRDRHRLAANVGTALIESGVRAVVVAGWRVHDGAALVFAETFYEHLLEGETFGEAVLWARRKCWEEYPDNTTWGAYQCYGDPFYRLNPEQKVVVAQNDLSLAQEIELELRNLASQARNVIDPDGEELQRLQKRAHTILARADELDIRSSKINEAEAVFQSYIGNYTAALDRFERLFSANRGNYQQRSYYRYINLKARHVTNEALAGKIKRADAYAQVRSFAEQLIAQQNSLGLGAVLYTDLGSIFKRKAALAETPLQAQKSLARAAEYYYQAATSNGLHSPEAIYHVCSFITLTALGEPLAAAKTKIKGHLGRDPEEYFDQWSDERVYLNAERDSPYALLRGANLKLAEIVWELVLGKLSTDKLRTKVDALIQEHYIQRERGFNVRDVRGQLENYDLLYHTCLLLDIGAVGPLEQIDRIRESLLPAAHVLNLSTSDQQLKTKADSPKPTSFFVGKDVELTKVKAENSANPVSQSRASKLIRDDDDQQLIVSVEIDLTVKQTSRGDSEKLSIKIPDDAVAALSRVTVDGDEDNEEHFLAWIPTADGAFAKTRGATMSTSAGWLEIYLVDEGRGKKIRNFFAKAKRVVVEFFRKSKNFVNKELRNKYNYQVLRLDTQGRIQYEQVEKENAFKLATLNGTDSAEHSLLMLHGMFNTAKGTFKDLLDVQGRVEPSFAKLLNNKYGGRALVMNMPTIFHSFQQNVKNLPVKTIQAQTLDIMANSRGTNVARHLCRVLDAGRGTKRGKVWLAGGPAYGTPLADADHMLTLVNRITMMMQAAGKPLGPIVPIVTWLLEQVAKKVLNGEGLKDMDPDSSSLKVLNGNWDFSNPNVHFVGSDFTPKKKLKRLIDGTLIDKAVMQGVENDGVIPTQATLGLEADAPYDPNDPLRYKVPESASIGHFMYYQHGEVLKRLEQFLR